MIYMYDEDACWLCLYSRKLSLIKFVKDSGLMIEQICQ